MKGLFTLELIQEKRKITRQSAINYISKLKKKGLVVTKGGGKQPRIYKIYEKPIEKENGMYEIINKYTPIKLYNDIKHITYGKKTTIEQTIVDCINKNDSRHSLAAVFLLNHIKNWKKLKNLIIQNNLEKKFSLLYELGLKNIKVKKIPKNLQNHLKKFKNNNTNLNINEEDIKSVKNDIS
jgi:predicted transcriptional regulator